MHLQPAALAIVHEASLPEPIHEETHPRPGCSDHLREGLLADFGDKSFGRPLDSCEKARFLRKDEG